jgi:hypothetical protein
MQIKKIVLAMSSVVLGSSIALGSRWANQDWGRDTIIWNIYPNWTASQNGFGVSY